MKIKINNLCKSYSSRKDNKTVTTIKAVDNISLEIPSNCVYGIIGKSGAGKSSLVRLISLLESSDSGSIFYNNDDVTSLSKKELMERHRKMGMIFQNFSLFSSRTAGGNVSYPLEISGCSKALIKQRVKELLSLVGLEGREDAPVSTLSGGQKQRVAIARALANNPDVLFCDEATSALDPETTRSILALIRDLQKKMNLTVIMITHQMEVVRDACDYVAVIDNGHIAEIGPVKDIFTNPASEVTKSFIRDIKHDGSSMQKFSSKNGKYLLKFLEGSSDEPILCHLSRECAVDFNILASGIEKIQDTQIGLMLVDFIGNQEEINKAIQYLQNRNVVVEEA